VDLSPDVGVIPLTLHKRDWRDFAIGPQAMVVAARKVRVLVAFALAKSKTALARRVQ
jgi:hypothetical protein